MTEGATSGVAAMTFIGTATMVLRLGPFTVLTDPNFLHRGERAYLGFGLWSRRRTDPAVEPAALPPLDGIVLSHLHGDHWDRVARRELDSALPVYTTPYAARRLASRQGFRNAVGMPTWSTERLTRDGSTLTVTALPGQHGRHVMHYLLPPVMGTLYQLETPGRPAYRLYVTGDTLNVPQLAEIAERYRDLDAVVLHLGGTRVLGALVTMDATEGTDLLHLVAPRRAVPIHYDDYPVFRSPLSAFQDAVRRRGLGDRVRYVERGQTVDLDPGPAGAGAGAGATG